MEKQFVRLHNHSLYSSRDGMLSLETIIEEATKANEISSVTDHGSIAGLLKYVNILAEKGVTGAPGAEFYINKNIDRVQELRQLIEHEKDKKKLADYKQERDSIKKGNHIIVIAKNTHGFYNLIKLNNKAYVTGFYNNPNISLTDIFNMDKDENGDYGVIITSACLAGIPSRYILQHEDEPAAREWIKLMKETFKDDFYLEVQVNNIDSQKTINKKWLEISKEMDIKILVGGDAHYLNKDWVETHQNLLLIQTKSKRKDLGKSEYNIVYKDNTGKEETKKVDGKKEFRKTKPEDITPGMVFGKGKNQIEIISVKKMNKTWEFSTDEVWYKGEKDIRKNVKEFHPELVNDIDSIIQNHYDLSEKLSPVEIDKNLKLPVIENAYEQLNEVVKKRLKEVVREFNLSEKEIREYIERIKYEWSVIRKFSFENYFYILWDIVNFVRSNDIGMGAGRGCFLGENKVLTKEGLKEIKDINNGEFVFSHGESFNEVTNKFEYQVEELLLYIDTENKKQIQGVTCDHKIFAIKKNDFEKGVRIPKWYKANELSEGDYIAEKD